MKKLLLLLILCAAPSFAANCNPNDQSGCGNGCNGATSGPTAISGTAWASNGVTGITEQCGFTFETTHSLLADCYWPTGAGSTTPMGLVIFAGGWNSGNWHTWQLGVTGSTILLAQTIAPGGSVVCSPSYRLSTTAAWPAQIQDLRQFLYWLVADAGSTIPGNRQNIWEVGTSASAQLVLVLGLSQNQTLPWTDSGSNTPTNNFSITRISASYVPDCIFTQISPCPYAQNQYSKDIMYSAGVGNNSGASYVVGDLVTVVQSGGSGGQVYVSGVNGSGNVTSVEAVGNNTSTGYTTASNLATTGGSGNGLLTVTISVGQNYNGTAFSELAGCAKWNISCGVTADNTYDISPILWMTSGNTNIKNIPMYFVSGTQDNVVPYNRTAAGCSSGCISIPAIGNGIGAASSVIQLASLGVISPLLIYPGGHEGAFGSSGGGTCANSNPWTCPAMQQIVQFLNIGASVGVSRSGGGSSIGGASGGVF